MAVTEPLRRTTPRPRVILLLGTTLVGILLIGAVRSCVHPSHSPPETMHSRAKGAPELRRGVVQIAMLEALKTGRVAIQCTGNGREILDVHARNLRREELVLEIPAGSVFESDSVGVVAIRPRAIPLEPGGSGETTVTTAALSARATRPNQVFSPREGAATQLAVLIPYLEQRPEIMPETIQTAVLALTENPPLSAFARFQLASGPSPGTPETDDFRVATRHLVEALQVLKAIGYPMERLALAADPQLKIEAMVDPLAHATALRLFNIRPGEEWAFWKQHLLEGPPATRHYALHGIARWFPSTALRMLPKWALREDLDSAYRVAAIRALAQTGIEPALPVLRHLRLELDPSPTLAAEIDAAMRELGENLKNPARFVPPVPFRHTPPQIRDAEALVPD